MPARPSYAWRLRCHRLNRILSQGDAPSADKAKAALALAIRRAGGFRPGMAGGVTRPSGGGWFVRAPVDRYSPITWDEWEPVTP